VCRQTVVLLLAVAKALGRDMAQQRMVPLLRQFFAFFDVAHPRDKAGNSRDGSDSPLFTTAASSQGAAAETAARAATGGGVDTAAELVDAEMIASSQAATGPDVDVEKLGQVFNAGMASFAYTGFCQLLGQITMQRTLTNSSLIERLSYGYDAQQTVDAVAASTVSSAPHFAGLSDGTGRTGFAYGQTEAAKDSPPPPLAGERERERSPTPDLTIEYERVELDAVQVRTICCNMCMPGYLPACRLAGLMHAYSWTWHLLRLSPPFCLATSVGDPHLLDWSPPTLAHLPLSPKPFQWNLTIWCRAMCVLFDGA